MRRDCDALMADDDWYCLFRCWLFIRDCIRKWMNKFQSSVEHNTSGAWKNYIDPTLWVQMKQLSGTRPSVEPEDRRSNDHLRFQISISNKPLERNDGSTSFPQFVYRTWQAGSALCAPQKLTNQAKTSEFEIETCPLMVPSPPAGINLKLKTRSNCYLLFFFFFLCHKKVKVTVWCFCAGQKQNSNEVLQRSLIIEEVTNVELSSRILSYDSYRILLTLDL